MKLFFSPCACSQAPHILLHEIGLSHDAERVDLKAKTIESGGSYLYQPAYATDHLLRLPAVPYEPQPGDIVFATDRSRFWKIMHNLAGTRLSDSLSREGFDRGDRAESLLLSCFCHAYGSLAQLSDFAASHMVWNN